jgi:3',5'-cyclic AMP phosphodiesterase CpdA
MLLRCAVRLCFLYFCVGSISCLTPVRTVNAADTPQPVSETDLNAPDAMPDRVLLGWKGDPAHSQAITWRTSTDVKQAFAEVTLAADGPFFVKDAVRTEATTTKHQGDFSLVHYHAINLVGLLPNTLYVYRVGDGVNWTGWTHFRTASDQADPFTFIYFGDAQNDVKSHWSRVLREAFSDAPRAKFMLHAGDLINRGNRDTEWGEWCAAGDWVNAMIPTIAIPGNHEYDITRTVPLPKTRAEQKKLPRSLATRWQARFEFPDNGPEEFRQTLGETAYFLDYQGVRIVAMNSMEDFDVQAKWLESVLKDNPNRWTVVTHHHPVYSASDGRSNPELRAAWQPLYDKYDVDIVLQGHDHSYGRTGFRRYAPNKRLGNRFEDHESGVVYVVSVSGPKLYDANQDPFVRRAEDTQLYQIINVDKDRLVYRAMTATGEVYDGFTLTKRDGQPNQLVEEVPDTPERRRQPKSDN